MPTLLIGETLGSFVGTVCHGLFPGIMTGAVGAYALVGMGAYFATVIRAPFTSILIVFELSRDYNIILPVMIANVVAYILSERFTEESIYEQISAQDIVKEFGHKLEAEKNKIDLEDEEYEKEVLRDISSTSDTDSDKKQRLQ